MKNIVKLLLMLIILSVTMSLTISSCGNLGEVNGIDEIVDDGDDDDDDDDEDELAFVTGGDAINLLQGTFLDAAVEGITYQGLGASGTTTSSGTFFYSEGSRVTFSIGGIVLGTAAGNSIVTPIDVAGATDESDQRVINMLRLLQTLDDDGDTSNGIKITQTTRTAAASMTADFDQTPAAFTGSTATNITTLTQTRSAGETTLISATDALNHFQSTLSSIGKSTTTVSTSFNAYDDFSSGLISSSLWTEIKEGTNPSLTVSEGIAVATATGSSGKVGIQFPTNTLASTSYRAFQADLKISSASASNENIRLEGYPYKSDNNIYTWLTLYNSGDVEFLLEDETTGTTLSRRLVASNVSLSTTQTMALGFDLSTATTYYRIGNTTGAYRVDTSSYPIATSGWTFAAISTRSYSSTITGNIDNVKIGSTSEIIGTASLSTPSTTLIGGARQGQNLSLSTTVSTFAGTAGTTGSTVGANALFNSPVGITAINVTDQVYVSNTESHRIVDIGSNSTLGITGIADSSGSIDGSVSSALFNSPKGIVYDGTNANIYVTDTGNHTIRKIALSGSPTVSTIAGTSTSSGSTDGTGTAALFNAPEGITTDGTNLYVTDTGNHTIRQIVISSGVVTTLAGAAGSSGTSDGTGTAALFNSPKGITTDGTNLYVTDTGNHTIRQIVISSGVVTTLAGLAGSSGTSNGTGTAALFNSPEGITSDGIYLYVTDTGNHTIRRMAIYSQTVDTLAGTAGSSGTTDGSGTSALFNSPKGIATDGAALYVIDTGNHTIRKIE